MEKIASLCLVFTTLVAPATVTLDWSKGPFTQAIFVAATPCNFCLGKIASSFKHVRSPLRHPGDILHLVYTCDFEVAT